MALLNDLSVELLSIIFECVYDSSSRIPPPRTSTTAKPLDATAPEMPEWSERNFRHPALFPYNISSVCMLWHDIVIRPPQYWRRIIFDVANDPTPFLDAFSWSSYLPIDVFVFSSANNANEDPVTKAHENSRVGSIVSRLQPEIIRCRTIIFDVTYASSLPSPSIVFTRNAPLLNELKLDCHVDDLEPDFENGNSTELKAPITETYKIPNPKQISLTGLAFLELCRLGRDWITELRPAFLCISRIQFKKNRDNRHTFTTFMDFLSRFDDLTTIDFKHVSLSYHPQRRTHRPIVLDAQGLGFDNVSRGFIAQFFTVVECFADYTFSHCSIPPIYAALPSPFLILQNVPPPHIHSATDDSLYNVLSAWRGRELIVSSCPLFNDELLDWLCGDSGAGFDAPFMMTLGIFDCPNFTPRAMRRLISARNDLSKLQDRYYSARDDVMQLKCLNVYGTGPALEKDDLEWFRDNAEKMNVQVNWTVVDGDGNEVPASSYLPDT